MEKLICSMERLGR